MSPFLLRPASKSRDSEVLPLVTVTSAAKPCSAIRLSRVSASGDRGRRLTLLLSGKSMSIVLSKMVRISTLSTSLSGMVGMYFPLHLGLNQTTVEQESARADCRYVYQTLDSRFRGNDTAKAPSSVMPA